MGRYSVNSARLLPSDIKMLSLRITSAQLLANFVLSLKKFLDLLLKTGNKFVYRPVQLIDLNLKLMRVSNVELHLCLI